MSLFSNKTVTKLGIVAVAVLTLTGFALSERFDEVNRVEDSVLNEETIAASADPAKAKAAFKEAAKVFFHARCVNCHPAGDIPLQGDAMTPHTQGVTRGKDGKGVYGMTCVTCHQSENLPGEHMPPGVANWHMPPANQPMVFEGLTARQLCQNFKNSAKNGGHKTAKAAMEHVKKRDPLVLWAWDPGNGRSVPPMSFEEFSAKVDEWVNAGGACPD